MRKHAFLTMCVGQSVQLCVSVQHISNRPRLRPPAHLDKGCWVGPQPGDRHSTAAASRGSSHSQGAGRSRQSADQPLDDASRGRTPAACAPNYRHQRHRGPASWGSWLKLRWALRAPGRHWDPRRSGEAAGLPTAGAVVGERRVQMQSARVAAAGAGLWREECWGLEDLREAMGNLGKKGFSIT